MNGGRARAAQCLLCPETFVVKDISDHIHEHIDYKPFHCNDCSIKTIHQSDLDQHTWEVDHTGSQHIDPYKQWLVEVIKKDIQFASKYGKDELLRRKNVVRLESYAPSTPPNQLATMRTPPQQPMQRPAPVSRPPARESSSSSDEDEEPRTSRKAAPAVQKRRSDNKRKNSDEGESEDDDNFSKGIQKLTKELEKTALCALCRKTIRISLGDRLKHVQEEHMDNVPLGPAYGMQLGNAVQRAFPGLVWNNTQCRKCPRNNKIQSTGGRQSHVVNYHNAFLNILHCPLQGCRFDNYDPTKFKSHFANDHSYTNNWSTYFPEFHKEWKYHKSNIDQISKLLFTVDFADGGTSATGRARRATDGDEEEHVEALRAIKATTAVKSPRSQPRATKKRRSKSPSSSSEEDDSDEEKPTNSKSKKQYKEKMKRKSDGSMGLVDVSDIETEGKEEEGDEQMDVDNKEDARNGSTTGSTNSGDNRSSQEDVKREQSPEQKEEIKQEPVTPMARAALGLPTQFTGSVRAPMPPMASNPFPTYESAHHGRRGGRGGMNRGGGGQYRGGGPRTSGGGPRTSGGGPRTNGGGPRNSGGGPRNSGESHDRRGRGYYKRTW